MSLHRLHVTSLAAWAMAVLAALAIRTALFAPSISAAEGIGWAFLIGAPAIVVSMIFRGSPMALVRVLHATERSADGPRDSHGSRS